MTTTSPTIGFTRVVASYSLYRDAESAIDHLSEQEFPVETVRIVGTGLKLIEHVTRRRGPRRAAGSGAFTGAILGVVMGVFVAIFSPADPLSSALSAVGYGLGFGTGAGAVLGLVAHALTRGHGDYSSVRSYHADRYDLEVLEDHADDALAILEG